jgi:hypothetical protein
MDLSGRAADGVSMGSLFTIAIALVVGVPIAVIGVLVERLER